MIEGLIYLSQNLVYIFNVFQVLLRMTKDEQLCSLRGDYVEKWKGNVDNDAIIPGSKEMYYQVLQGIAVRCHKIKDSTRFTNCILPQSRCGQMTESYPN